MSALRFRSHSPIRNKHLYMNYLDLTLIVFDKKDLQDWLDIRLQNKLS